MLPLSNGFLPVGTYVLILYVCIKTGSAPFSPAHTFALRSVFLAFHISR